MAQFKIGIYNDFFSAFAKLPTVIMKKTHEFIYKLNKNPKSPGLHIEKISKACDKKLFSGKVDDNYRVIIAIQESTGTYLLLYVDKHDDAYHWANNKKLEVNKLNGSLQLFDIVTSVVERRETIVYLFDKFTDDQLLSVGVPEIQIKYVRTIETYNDLIQPDCKSKFSRDTYQALDFLGSGYDLEEVLDLFKSDEETKPAVEINESLDNDVTKQSFVVVDGEKELDEMLKAPLEKWRTFLHPSQRKLVTKDFSGPYKVTGEAGTGKTVVAMHRAKYLAQDSNRKILFTTFTSNLVGDIKENLKVLLPYDSIPNVNVINIDKLIIQFLNSHNESVKIVYNEDDLSSYWKKAILDSKEEFALNERFFMDEWHKIAMCMDELSYQKYLSVPRVGRGVRLDKMNRLKVWHVFEKYVDLIKKNHIADIDYATYRCREILKKEGIAYYDSIIIDESQDISNNTFKFLRLLVGEEHPNDLFICGDSHQRIYKNKAVLSKCGINVKGRSSVLRINYRTTEETRNYAYGLLNNIEFDDLDNTFAATTNCRSLIHGDKPNVKSFIDSSEQAKFVLDEIYNLHNLNDRAQYNEICIVSRNHKQLDNIAKFLEINGIPTFKISDNCNDSYSEPGVRLATMHRVKGLEFKYIFAISVNNAMIPVMENYTEKYEIDENLTIERSLLYVALTRTRNKAYVLCFGNPSEFIKVNVDIFIKKDLKDDVDKYINNHYIKNYSERNNDNLLDSIKFKKPGFTGEQEKGVTSLSQEVDSIGKSFSTVLLDYITEKNLKDSEVYKKANISKSTFSRIRSDESYIPLRNNVLALCFVLQLSIDQTEDLIKRCGFSLSPSSKFDIIFKYFIIKKDYDIENINNVLYEYDLPYLIDYDPELTKSIKA